MKARLSPQRSNRALYILLLAAASWALFLSVPSIVRSVGVFS